MYDNDVYYDGYVDGSEYLEVEVDRYRINSMFAPYLKHQKKRIKDHNLTIKKICDMINNIDVHMLDYVDDDGIQHYKLIKAINIKPIEPKEPISKNERGIIDFFTYDRFLIKLNVDSYKYHHNIMLPKEKKEQTNYKPERFVKSPKDLYETISKNVDNSDDLEDFYKLYLTTIATNTNNSSKIKRTQAEVLAMLPPDWIRLNSRDKLLRLELTIDELNDKFDKINKLTETLKLSLETDIKLISKIDFDSQGCTIYYI